MHTNEAHPGFQLGHIAVQEAKWKGFAFKCHIFPIIWPKNSNKFERNYMKNICVYLLTNVIYKHTRTPTSIKRFDWPRMWIVTQQRICSVDNFGNMKITEIGGLKLAKALSSNLVRLKMT